MNYLPPALRALLMFGLGIALLVIGVANLWVVLRRRPALVVEPSGLTLCSILQRRRLMPWRDFTRIVDGKASLLLHRANQRPLVVGYDWFDGTPEGIRSSIERHWSAAREGRG